MASPSPIALRFHKRQKPILLRREVPPAAEGIVLRDTDDREHHFGARELTADGTIFDYVASYGPDEGPQRMYHIIDALREGFDVVEPAHGPTLTPLTRRAVDCAIAECARKGFAFDYEKEIAVNTFQALMEGDEPFPPADLEVYGATHGFDLEQAADFRDLAERVIAGRYFRPAIKLPRGHGQKLRDYWAQKASGQ